jgi:hypothetical protein
MKKLWTEPELIILQKEYPTTQSKEGPKYMIGMSVPPVMVAQIATEISNQWLTKINN